MLDLSLLAEAGSPAVSLDGPETALFVWDAAITVLFGTILTRLWVRAAANEKIQAIAGFISPNITSKGRFIMAEADEIAKMLSVGDVPSERIKIRAEGLSRAASEMMSGQ